MGFRAFLYQGLQQQVGNIDLLFNTIPTMIVTAQIIANLPSRAVIIDFASKPGGTDFRFAEKRGIKALLAPGLPGIVAPKTAGRIMADCLSRLMRKIPGNGGMGMKWQGKTVGYALSGSHCTFEEVMPSNSRDL